MILLLNFGSFLKKEKLNNSTAKCDCHPKGLLQSHTLNEIFRINATKHNCPGIIWIFRNASSHFNSCCFLLLSFSVDFLAKYCIFSQEKLLEYKRAFEAVSEGRFKPFLFFLFQQQILFHSLVCVALSQREGVESEGSKGPHKGFHFLRT